jgi:lipase maturation factor 1
MEGPLLIFDGECRFCRKSVARLQAWAPEEIPAKASQECGQAFPDISCEDFEGAVQYIDRRGQRHTAARAIFQCMAEHGISRWPLRAYEKIPGLASVLEWGYRWVARNRSSISKVEFALCGPSLKPPTYQLSIGLFLRGLGLVYALAFLSLAPQISGLAGPNGIQPASDYLHAVAQHFGGPAVFKVPTLFWIDSSSTALESVCWAGALLGLMAAAGITPRATLGLAFLLHLSLVQAGGVFLAFQWDNLLLEVGVLALLLAGWGTALRKLASPHFGVGRWLLWWLLFRLMFCSGVVKLSSGDLAWSSLTALDYHFETQPLPTLLAWWMHQLPSSVLAIATATMFAFQLLLPFAIWGPRRLKLAAAAGFVLLEGAIALTGNYGYFNLLSILLALTLVDDTTWSRFGIQATPEKIRTGPLVRCTALIWGLMVLVVSVPLVVRSFRVPFSPPLAREISSALAPFRVINGYGLFAVMTQERREITLEGSEDGVVWKAYRFRWKPDQPADMPKWVAPHMPRLDWQMWFAALGRAQDNPWFVRMAYQLLQGSPEVAGLFAENPFPDAPPRYLRARIRLQPFTSMSEREQTGDWWNPGLEEIYLPAVSRENFR